MKRLSGSFQRHGSKDATFKVELPERSSTYSPEQTDPVTPERSAISPERSPVSPQSQRFSSPGLESLRHLVDEKAEKPGATSPGLESLRDFICENGEGPIVVQPEKEYYSPEDAAPEVDERPTERPPKYKRKKLLFWALAVVAGIAVGLAVGLGVGLSRHKGNSPNMSANAVSQGRPNNDGPSTYSTTGAFNGSGIALASQSFSSGGYGSIVMYFQHHTGQIRSAQLGSDGRWKGGDATEIVAVDAKNGTPIAAVAYARNNIAVWHIFYLDINNTVTEIINSNTTNVWRPGPINDLHLQAMDDPNVGLQACWYGDFYSDVSYNHSPVPGQQNSTGDHSDQTVGIHLWYAKSPTAFDSVGWTYGDTTWSEQQTFDGYNGHAGVGCYSWGPGSNTYVFFADLNDEINILWKDLNTSLPSTPSHPINQWMKANVTIPVYKNSSVGFTNYLYAQNPDLSISGFNVTWAAEKTSIEPKQNFVVNGEKGLPSTHLSVTALPNASGGNSLLVFYQTNGSDITEFVRDLDAGQWTSSSVPIPDA